MEIIDFEKLKTIEKAASYANQEVQIKGFAYQDADEKWVLCPLPNLRTCCLHKESSCAIHLKGFSYPDRITHAIKMQGIFKIEDAAYVLEKPQQVEEASISLNLSFLFIAGCILVFLGAWRHLNRVNFPS